MLEGHGKLVVSRRCPFVCYLNYNKIVMGNLEDTGSVSEGGDVSSRVLLVHGLSGKNLSNHISHDSHHSGTSVVKLNIKLAGLLLGVLNIGSEVSYSVISVVLGGRHPCELNKGEESKDLGKSGSGDGTDSVNSGGNIRELKVGGRGKVSVEGDVVVVYDNSYNGCHGNTSVLTLDGTTTLEGLGLSLEPSKRIIDSEGLGDSKLNLRNLKRGGGLGGGGRGECGSRGNKEGGDEKLHFDC
eukprot:918305_1